MRARARTDGTLSVTSCHVMHSCRPGSHPSTSAALVDDIARDVLRYDIDAKPADVIAHARVDFGYLVTYTQAYRALATVRKSFTTTSELSYGLVMPWLQGMHVQRYGLSTWYATY